MCRHKCTRTHARKHTHSTKINLEKKKGGGNALDALKGMRSAWLSGSLITLASTSKTHISSLCLLERGPTAQG